MLNKWFYRVLLSYLPIFITVSVLLVIIFFLFISNVLKNEAERINELNLQHIDSTISYALKTIDDQLIVEALSPSIAEYMNEPAANNLYLMTKTISDRLRALTQNNPLIESAYIYKTSDQTVLSNTAKLPLHEFGDRQYVLSLGAQDELPWTGARPFKLFDTDSETISVVSLARELTSSQGEKGYLVANVPTSELKKLIMDSNSLHEINDIRIFDRHEELILQTDRQADVNPAGANSLVSNYTQWTITSSNDYDRWFNILSALSDIWIMACIVVIGLGFCWFIIVTRRHYKPIKTITYYIRSQFGNHSDADAEPLSDQTDEFKMIKNAFDKLVKQNSVYELESKEGLVYRRKQLLYDLMHGHQVLDRRRWELEMRRCMIPMEDCRHIYPAVMEIDDYRSFEAKYNEPDQNLLKYILKSALEEMALNEHFHCWAEWIDGKQIGILLQMNAKRNPTPHDVKVLFQSAQEWYRAHLKFTVSIGIGSPFDNTEECALSFEEACSALQYKAITGMAQVLLYPEIERPLPAQAVSPIEQIRSVVQSFRAGHEGWSRQFEQFIDNLKLMHYTRDDIRGVLQFFIYHFHQELINMGDDYRQLHSDDDLFARLNQILEDHEILDDWKARLLEVLTDIFERIGALRNHNDKHHLIQRVKHYIETNYANSDLSLALLGDQFGINGNYLSRLFKDEYGEKFIDYVQQIRIAESRRLMERHPELPVQEIGVRVGYPHAKTFIRIFKKECGVTPGEYKRKLLAPASDVM